MYKRQDLDGVIAQPLDPGQDLHTEFVIGADARLFLCHADVAFVDIKRLLRAEGRIVPLVRRRRRIDDGVPGPGLRLLDDIVGIEGDRCV